MKPVRIIILSALLAVVAVGTGAETSRSTTAPAETYPGLTKVLAHIQESIPQTLRTQKVDHGGMIGLPHPYTSPCARDTFVEMFYWDTYFMNLGLLRNGGLAQAKNNTDNLLFLADKLGYVPNANQWGMTNRSQPPLLPWLVRDDFAATGDRAWLKQAYGALVKEYNFWMSQRMSPTGLNRNYNSATEADLMGFYDFLARERFKGLALATKEQKLRFSSHSLSEAESGCDFSPRFDRRCEDFCAVDLNAILYLNETILADFSRILNNGEESGWRAKAAKRKELIQKLHWNEKVGCYTDYDFVKQRQGDRVSCATFYPLLAGIATPKQAKQVVRKMKAVLEYEHGLTTCEPRPSEFVYQWDHPNAWPPLQAIAVLALDRYGFKADARRIAEKYLRAVIANYEKTGDLWEKYNVVTGTTDVVDEYKMPRMVGWTAGVFVFAAQRMEQLPKDKDKPLQPRSAQAEIDMKSAAIAI